MHFARSTFLRFRDFGGLTQLKHKLQTLKKKMSMTGGWAPNSDTPQHVDVSMRKAGTIGVETRG